ncbi:MAG TPA: DUF4331 domain-containing protein [Nonomuraea sp.]|nr:DUF4331 domain-containing protein [Nonomuraea sp.]
MTRLTVGRAIAGITSAMVLPVAAFSMALAPVANQAGASSHREAPMISQDPAADGTDVYAFTSPGNADTVTLVYNTWPLEDPFAGPNFFRFDPNVLYSIKVDNNGDNKADVTYEFRFRTDVKNGDTLLYNTGAVTSIDDPDLNVRQFYNVTRVTSSGRTDIANDVPVPPVNIGPKSTPNYSEVARQAVKPLTGGGQVFAGQRADPFFVDLSATFDLLTIRKLPGTANNAGIDSLEGKNVQAIVLQVPKSQLSASGQNIAAGDLGNKDAVIGVWATSSRQKTRVLNPGAAATLSGEWVQISRLGNPLVNEVVLPLGIKDAFNAISPDMDVAAGALPLVQRPEPERLLKALYGIKTPDKDRADLVAIFLTGVPGSLLGLPGGTAPMNVPAGSSTASEMLRLNMGTPATPIRGLKSRLGVVGGDVLGFPNGRRLEDDVVDIALQAVAGVTYPLVDRTFTPDPVAGQLGDGVPSSSAALLDGFPYLATPHRGYDFNTASTAPFIRCGTGGVFRLNADQSLGSMVTNPADIGNEPILTASAAFPLEGMRAICGAQFK